MDATHAHLLVNHVPILLPVIGLLILLAGMWSNSEAVKRTAYVLFVAAAFAAGASMLSGEEAEHALEGVIPQAETYIEPHEEAAEVFAYATYVLAAVSLLALWVSFKRPGAQKWVPVLVAVVALGAIATGVRTGATGGEIRHEEIR